MWNVLHRLEDGLVQVLRMVLLVFSLLLLLGMTLWVWDYFKPQKSAAVAATETAALNWKDAKLDLAYVVDETRRDLGNAGNDIPMEKRLADPELRPSFQKADALLRGFIYMNPAQRKRIESDNNSQGLAPVHALLKGDALPTPEEVDRQIKLRESRESDDCCSADPTDAAASAVDAVQVRSVAESAARAAALAAASATAVEEEEQDGQAETDEALVEPIDVAASIHERASMAQMEHGPGAYAAYVQGLPGALEKVLGNEDLAPILRNQSAQGVSNLMLINYTLAFDRTAMTLKGEEPSSSWMDRFQSVEMAFWSLLMSLLVLVVMVLVFIRMERHLKVMSQQARLKD